jgi:hypothetical protein
MFFQLNRSTNNPPAKNKHLTLYDVVSKLASRTRVSVPRNATSTPHQLKRHQLNDTPAERQQLLLYSPILIMDLIGLKK